MNHNSHNVHQVNPPHPWFNDELDLILEKTLPLAPEWIWRAYTEPELLKQWFCPRPWTVSDCELDVRPGGICSTTMRSPEGVLFPNVGCYLETDKNKKLVWTNTMLPGFRPAPTVADPAHFEFSAVILLNEIPGGTRYTAIVTHGTKEHRAIHDKMGFYEGWGIVLDQLVELGSRTR